MNVTSLEPRAIDTEVVADAEVKQTFVVIIRCSNSEWANHRAIHRSVRYANNGTKITFKTNFILIVSPTVDDNDVV